MKKAIALKMVELLLVMSIPVSVFAQAPAPVKDDPVVTFMERLLSLNESNHPQEITRILVQEFAMKMGDQNRTSGIVTYQMVKAALKEINDKMYLYAEKHYRGPDKTRIDCWNDFIKENSDNIYFKAFQELYREYRP